MLSCARRSALWWPGETAVRPFALTAAGSHNPRKRWNSRRREGSGPPPPKSGRRRRFRPRRRLASGCLSDTSISRCSALRHMTNMSSIAPILKHFLPKRSKAPYSLFVLSSKKRQRRCRTRRRIRRLANGNGLIGMDVRAFATNTTSFLCDEAPARLPLDESLRLGRCVGAEMAPQDAHWRSGADGTREVHF